MADKQKNGYLKELTKGLLKENPVLRLVLGTCPTLATSTSVVNGIGMGIAATIVLICSNTVISALRKVIPEKARIPAYIVIIASFVTVVQMLVKAFVPALDQSLGVFLPLIVVNCIILGRAEAFAGKNPVLLSAVDGLGMGIGFTAALFCMGTIREIAGAGTFLSGIDTMLGAYIDLGTFTGFDFVDELESYGLAPMTLFILPAGGFFVFGMLMALANKLAEKKGMESATLRSCSGCPHASFCKQFNDDGVCTEENTDTPPEAIKDDTSAKPEEAQTEIPSDAAEAKAEVKTVEAQPEVETVEAETEVETVEAKPEVETVEAETKVETVEAETKVETVEAETEVETVEAETGVETVEAQPEVETVEAETEVETVEAETEVETVEAETEVDTVEAETEVDVVETENEVETAEAQPEVETAEAEPEAEAVKTETEEKTEQPVITVKDIMADAATKQAKAESDRIDSKSYGRKKKKRNKKTKEKPQPVMDFTEPLPEVIPDCIKRDIEKNKRQEDKKE